MSFLTRSLSRFNLFTLTIGSTIGAGLYYISYQVAIETGPAISVSFLLITIITILSALCFSEFASAVPLTGSAYTYTYVTIGELPAFIVGWSLLIEYLFTAVVLCQYFGHSIENLLGHNLPEAFVSKQFSDYFSVNIIAGMFSLLVTIFLSFGIKRVVYVIFVGTTVSLSVVLFIVFYGSSFIDTANWNPFFPKNGFIGILTGARLLFFSILGFDGVVTFAEEVENPEKDIPFVIITSIIFCGGLYSVVGLIFTGIIPIEEMRAYSLTVNDLFFYKGSNWGGILVSLGALVSLFTGTQICFMSVSRVLFAMSRDRLLPTFFSHLNSSTNEPLYACLVSGILITLLSLFLPQKYYYLIDVVSIGTLLTFTFVNTAVLKLRENVPEAPSSKKLRYYLFLYVIASIFLGVIAHFYVDLIGVGFGILLIPFLIICYHFYVYLPYPIVFSTRYFLTPLVPLIPLIGISTNIFYIISSEPFGVNFFVCWLVIGLIVYVGYSIRHSLERRQSILSENVPLIRSSDD